MGRNSYEHEDWNSYHRKYRTNERSTVLSEFTPEDKRCPLCRALVTNSRSWVLAPLDRKRRSTKEKAKFIERLAKWAKFNLPPAICRSCYFLVTSHKTIIRTGGEKRYVWNGELLAQRVGNKRQLANLSGLSDIYVRQLCMRFSFFLDKQKTKAVMRALVRLRVNTKGMIRFTYTYSKEEDDDVPTDFADWKHSKLLEKGLINIVYLRQPK
jgi:hypothetical protein